ncbi:MAG: hypothetical protein J6C12_06455 [Lachnospiraceae bacterium]|nr:hypothetical protein [Lachnospiraceae bacterium]
MKNRILSYRNRIDDLLAHPEQISDINAVIEEHLVQISFFQHERLVHLIVTVTVAILTLMSAGIFIATSYVPVIMLFALLMVLLVPYIMHYYTLENEVQKMYVQYDRMLEIQQKNMG